MRLLLFCAAFCLTISQIFGKKICEQYLPGNGVDVNNITNKVIFPATHSKPIASKIATKYDSKGLDPFFNLAKSFMNNVAKNDLPKMTDSNGKMKKVSDIADEVKAQKGDLYKFEVPILATFGIGVVLALLMPVIGFCLCCCRCCCNKCGGEMIQSKENSEAHCKCCVFSSIVFVMTIFILCGVLMMYVTNNNLKKEIAGTGKTYDDALDEGWSYLKTIRDQLSEITENKTNCLYEELIVPDISDKGVREEVGVKLKNKMMPHVIGALNAVKDATKNVTAMNDALATVSNTTAELRGYAATLKTQLDKARSDLDEVKANCSSNPLINGTCAGIDTTNLKQEANFTQLPNVDSELSNIRGILNQNFSGAVDEGFAVFNKIPDTVVEKAKPTLTNIRKLAKDGKEKLKNSTKSIFDQVDKIINNKKDYQKYKSDYVDKYVDYDKFRFYGYIGLAAIVTWIVLLLSLGLACGVCGYSRDNNPVQRSSISNHGGNCLLAAVGFMFLSAFVLFMLTAVFFFIGEHLHVICRELKDGKIIDKYSDGKIKLNGTALKVETILKNCRNNMAVYEAINAKAIYNFEDKLNITKLINIDKQLDSLNVNVSDQNILNSDTKKSLQDLQNSSVANINFTSFLNELSRSIVAVDLTKLSNQLKNTSASLRATSNHSAVENLAKSFDRIADDLMTIKNGTIANIIMQSNLMKANVIDLKARANNLSSVADDILKKLEKANSYVINSAPTDVLNAVKEFSKRVLGWPTQFVDHIMSELKNNLARCKPIANIYDGFINVYFCTGIVRNFNGFWLAMGWCIFFFPFTIIFGVKLSKYFRKMRMLSGFDSDPVAYPGYDQHAVKIPLQELHGATRNHRHGAGQMNPRYDGHASNAAPPPYSA